MANPYEHASKFSQVFFIIYPRSIAMRFAARFSNKFSFGMKSHLDLITYDMITKGYKTTELYYSISQLSDLVFTIKS